jgi:flagellar hook-basal body complex protein FliE
MSIDQPYRSNTNTSSPTGSNHSPKGSNQQTSSGSLTQDVRNTIGDAVSRVSDAAQQAGSGAKDAAYALASDANKKATGLLNQQFATGADFAGNIAEAVNAAADSLEQKSPQLAKFVRGAAETVEEFSKDIRGQTVQELVKTASDFTRKQPALVFGLASLAGFAVFRVLKSNTPAQSPYGEATSPRGQNYGSRNQDYGSRNQDFGSSRSASGASYRPGHYHGS